VPYEKKKYLKSYRTTTVEEEEILVDQENADVEQACRHISGRENNNNNNIIILHTRIWMLHYADTFRH
jgi:hypothetical protein